MKFSRFTLFFLISIILFCLAGCDDSAAVLEYYSDSKAGTVAAYDNPVGYATNYPEIINVGADEKVKMHFYCPYCKHSERVEAQAPYSQLFSCDC